MSLRPWAEATKDLPPGRLLDVAGREVGIERAGGGAPLVLLHGFGESTLAVEKVIPDLARHFDVVAIDLNGFGYTQRPRERASYTLAGQAHLVLDVMDRLGFEKVTLGGHSYGGGIALYLAAEHPERIERLLLVDNVLPIFATRRRAPFFAWRWVVNLVVHTFGLRDKRIEEGLLESYYDDSLVTPTLIREYAERLRIEGAVDAYRGLMGPTEEPPYELDLATIRQPTLVVWGAEDALIPAEDARETSSALPDGRFVEIPACGHNPMDECPQQFLDAALPFLLQTSAAPGRDPVPSRH